MKSNITRITKIILLALALCVVIPSVAQTVKQQDYSNIHVDELSDEQIRAFIAQFQSKGLNEAQLDQEALAGGMSGGELQKLHSRVEQMKGSMPSTSQYSGRQLNSGQDTVRNIINPKTEAEKALSELKSKIFASDLFSSGGLTFEPNLRLATPANYQIGPDDEILIDIYGNSEANYKLKVSPEGGINVPYIGLIQVSGMTVEQAALRIRSRLSQVYSGLRTGKTFLNVNIGNIRSIKVTITGETVRPGTYTLPSLATAYNALSASGGPSENGSFREINIIRAGKKIASLDIYDFYLYGDLKNNITLQDQDIIHIPYYKIRVEVVGQVKHPAIFEMLSGEKLSNLIQFAGDFTEQAYRSRIRAISNTEKERKTTDLTLNDFNNYQPATGDKFYIDKILDRFENQVNIKGAVFRPGPYELTPGLTVGQLIRKAEGLTEDAFQNRGIIIRLKDNLQMESVAFDVNRLLAGQIPDLPLKREDIVNISSISDLKEEYTFKIQGEIQQPGTFKFSEGMNLEDAIIMAGGLKESATYQRIEVSRRVKNSNALSLSAKTADIFTLNVNEDLRTSATPFLLQPFDIVTVRPSSGYEIQKPVQITGEVFYPGNYVIEKKNERISDLLERAGGLTVFAYPEGASLKRPGPLSDSLEIKRKREENLLKQIRLQKAIGDSSRVINISDEEVIRNNNVGIDLPGILKNPGGKEDIFLEEGDILVIPKQLQTVRVSGQVLSPNTVVYIKNKSFKQYISNAGGFSDKSMKSRSYILYANGSVRSTHKIFFFNNYPTVKPGSEIFVPQKEEKKKLSAAELVGLSTGLATLAALILNLLKL